MSNLLNKAQIKKVADAGKKIYDAVKAEYDPKYEGQFLAIDTESGNVYLGKTSDAALNKARAAHPGHIFYLVKIGFDTIETMAKSLILHFGRA